MRSATATAALALLLGACAGGPQPRVHYYTLGPPGQPAANGAASAASGLALGVDSFAVDPPYDQDRLVYRLGSSSGEVGFYDYHRWAAPLGRLAAAALADGLVAVRGIASAEPSAAGGDYGARLAGRVIHLEEIDQPGGRQEVRLAIALDLTDATDSTLWTGNLTASTTLTANDASEVMAAVQRVFADFVGQARGEIARALTP